MPARIVSILVVCFSTYGLAACSQDGSSLRCGEGTTESDGICVPLSDADAPGGDGSGGDNTPVVCGEGTVEVEGECVVQEAAPQCAPNPCVGVSRARCVVEEGEAVCLCSYGYVDDDGVCRPEDAGPLVSIISGTGTAVQGDTVNFVFEVDRPHTYRLELGGLAQGEGVLLATGSDVPEGTVIAQLDTAEIDIGAYALRLYVTAVEGVLTGTTVVDVPWNVAGELRVLVWSNYCYAATATMVRDALHDDLRTDAWSYSCTSSPPSEGLGAYDVVVLYNTQTDSALGDALANFVDAGGGLVLLGGQTQYDLQGNIATGGYLPLRNIIIELSLSEVVVPNLPGHPILANVDSLGSYSRSHGDLQEGATQVAEWGDGVILAATKGPVVFLGLTPDTDADNFYGDWATLIANAAVYAASQAD